MNHLVIQYVHIVCVFVNTSGHYLDTLHLVAIFDPNLHNLCKICLNVHVSSFV